MRAIGGAVLALSVVVGVPVDGQVISRPTQKPTRTAVHADWYLQRTPIFVTGDYYYPAGASVFFDANTMVLIGFYDSVPLYADSTLEPHSIVLVPIGRGLMQPYERRRERELVGTVGSRPPSFPVQRDVEATGGVEPPAPVGMASAVPAAEVDDTGHIAEAIEMEGPVRTALPPGGTSGVWVEFEGARWLSSGAAVPFAPGLFMQAGEYRGFPVYRSRQATGDVIYLPSRDSLVAPYRREQP